MWERSISLKALFSQTKGPQKAYYKRYKKAWLSLELDTNTMQLFDGEKNSGNNFLIENANQSLAWSVWHILKQKTFPRDDYRELN